MIATVKSLTRRFVSDERGIQHAEEALILALIAVASVAVVSQLGTDIGLVFSAASTCLQTASSTPCP